MRVIAPSSLVPFNASRVSPENTRASSQPTISIPKAVNSLITWVSKSFPTCSTEGHIMNFSPFCARDLAKNAVRQATLTQKNTAGEGVTRLFLLSYRRFIGLRLRHFFPRPRRGSLVQRVQLSKQGLDHGPPPIFVGR